MKSLRKLGLCGTEISDVGIRYITQFLSQLSSLRIAGCWKVTDAGLAQLAAGPTAASAAAAAAAQQQQESPLTHLDVSNCKGVTNAGLQHLVRCPNLISVNCVSSGVTHEGLKKFAEESSADGKRWLKAQNGAVVEKKIKK